MNQVKALRGATGLSQRELADLSGVAQPNIAAYESGRRAPSATMLERLRLAARPRPSVVVEQHGQDIVAIAERHKALSVSVFGSAARGDDGPGSDLDLLVRFAPDASLVDQVGLAQELEDTLGIRVDVVSEGGLRRGHDHILAQARPL